MCILLTKPADRTITRDCLYECYTSNRDGIGFAYYREDIGEVCIQKGFFDFDLFYKTFQEFQKYKCIVHFRIATHKAVNGKNCHPWRVNDNLIFGHNGSISGMNKDDNYSDTGNFNEEILKPLMEESPDFYLTDQFKWLISNAIGKNNKLAFLDSKGNHVIINESEGHWTSGCWFSNSSYKPVGTKAGFKICEEDPDPVVTTPTFQGTKQTDTKTETQILEKVDLTAKFKDDPAMLKIAEDLKKDGFSEVFATEEELDGYLEVLNSKQLVNR